MAHAARSGAGQAPHLRRSHRSHSPLESRGRAARHGLVGMAGPGPKIHFKNVGGEAAAGDSAASSIPAPWDADARRCGACPALGPVSRTSGGSLRSDAAAPAISAPRRTRARRRGACREWRTPPDPVRGKPRTYDVPTGCHSPLESRGRADRRGVVEKAGTGPKVCFTNIGVKPPQAIQLHLRSPHLGKRTPVDAGLAPHWALFQERWWEAYVATPLRPRFPHLAERGARRRGACREWRTPPDPVRGKPRTYNVPTGAAAPLSQGGAPTGAGLWEKRAWGPMSA